MEPTITHWDKERIQARDEIRQFERAQALEQIALLMRKNKISIYELKSLMDKY